ncbi:Ubiquitin carboxyl-terminal hydrolase-related protein [Melia azedarach]|uniref:Ubiquitin carboxyl-terminal hydrolase-related protein n=1 Tax=Melia azedarach TaxID=155640 RepID=A0ACC1XBC3_MELAZ|nr:Ubiquitin carboxyl-terminal hydrolase-related protein [Melia azedarach]
MKIKRELCSFDMVLKLVEMSGKLSCDLDGGGCGQINQICHTLWCLPHVFIIVLDWQNTAESFYDISATMSTLSSELDLSLLFHGYQPGNEYFHVSMLSSSGYLVLPILNFSFPGLLFRRPTALYLLYL